MNDATTQIMGGTPGQDGAFLGQVIDPQTGQYYRVVPDAAIEKLHQEGWTGRGTTTAVIDTGLVLSHPSISRVLKTNSDYTGEGPEDLNGHGTLCTLLLLSSAPDTELINVKVLGRDGFGRREALVDGIQWSVAEGADIINISAGVYTSECVGNCDVCQAAVTAASSGSYVVAAAGNVDGRTACPAKGYPNSSGVFSVMAYDLDAKQYASYSGEGNIGADVGHYKLAPV